jgi:hypothetical protein
MVSLTIFVRVDKSSEVQNVSYFDHYFTKFFKNCRIGLTDLFIHAFYIEYFHAAEMT